MNSISPENPLKLIRLNKFISNSGVCTRRGADILIKNGEIKVNDDVITELGFKVDPSKDRVSHLGILLKGFIPRYILFNKAQGITIQEHEKEISVHSILDRAIGASFYPLIGLGTDSLGLVVLSNSKTSFNQPIECLYHLFLDDTIDSERLISLTRDLSHSNGSPFFSQIELVQDGKGREVGIRTSAMDLELLQKLALLGLNVVKLDRVMIGELTKKDIPRGRWRELTFSEVSSLRIDG